MRLFCFGFGYSAAALAGRLSLRGFTVTSRSEEGCLAIEASGHEAVRFTVGSIFTEPLDCRCTSFASPGFMVPVATRSRLCKAVQLGAW